MRTSEPTRLNAVTFVLLAAAAAAVIPHAATAPRPNVSAGQTGGSHLPNMAHLEFPAGADCDQHLQDAASKIAAAGCSQRTETNTDLFCGASFECSTADKASNVVAGLQTAVVNTYPVRTRSAPKSHGRRGAPSSAPLDKINSRTGVADARTKLGLTGKGVKVAVIDTGVYYLHPALGGGFGPGFKVAFGRDFVGDGFGSANLTAVPDADPMDDCSGDAHGSHVAGIIAGVAVNVTGEGFVPFVPWVGVAPEATIGAYRIFGCAADTTTTDIIAAAIYQAAADGASVINLSLGGSPCTRATSRQVAAARVGATGSIAVSSNGNDGDKGFMSGENPAGSLGGFGVANFANYETIRYVMTVDGVTFPWSSGLLNGSFELPNDGCSSVGDGAKAKYCLIYADGGAIVTVSGGPIPTASTSREAGAAILASKAPTVVLTKNQSIFDLPTGGTVSSFSSTGLDAELHIKPDIGGIGDQMYSTISPFAARSQSYATAYAEYDGTSMAAAYMSGAVALYVQSKGNTTFETVRAAFMNGAEPVKMFESSLVASVAAQGAGLVNVYRAITAKTVVTPPALALNDSDFREPSYSITLKNGYSKPVTYSISSFPAATVNMFDGKQDYIQTALGTTYTTNSATIGFGSKHDSVLNVTVAGGSSQAVPVSVTPPAATKPFPVFSGFIAVANNVDDTIQHVPYAGMAGRWKTAPILSVNASAAFTYVSGFYVNDGSVLVSANAVFNMSVTNIMVAPIYATTTRLSYFDAVYAGNDEQVEKTLKALGVWGSSKAANERGAGYLAVSTASLADPNQVYYEWAPRNSPTSGTGVVFPTTFYWGGFVVADPTAANASYVKLPAGEYKLRLKGLHHFALARNATDSSFDIVEMAHPFLIDNIPEEVLFRMITYVASDRWSLRAADDAIWSAMFLALWAAPVSLAESPSILDRGQATPVVATEAAVREIDAGGVSIAYVHWKTLPRPQRPRQASIAGARHAKTGKLEDTPWLTSILKQ
ncbi:peptidase S8/S53 domain-containing protein [Zopfochytrium polystomum]|nr:peptidase S8/S53 domain-containing protein [Zopfochytrium polystomum]